MRLRPGTIATVLVSIFALPTRSEPTKSTKRGLCYVPDPGTPEDDYIWIDQPGRLSWYYTYTSLPPSSFHGLSQESFEFVPMLWGAPSDINDTSFLNTVQGLSDDGMKISNVLTFNEPDLAAYGGSNVTPAYGAQVWVNNIVPLQNMGIRAGLPVLAGTADHTLIWLEEFLGNCSRILGTSCMYDFVALHWYGSFEGLASRIGEYNIMCVQSNDVVLEAWELTGYRFPNTPMWVTEFNLNNQSLNDTQSFFEISTEYLDRLPHIERYSFFGAFRSSVSNVGTNATMLSAEGRLTDIGRWYLGRPGNGVDSNKAESGSAAPLILYMVFCAIVISFLSTLLVV